MDLLSTIRKSGSRGGVNFSWDEVQTSQHRENYLGHSLMAPVGRWQKGKDLNWYAKGDSTTTGNETAEEKQARERKDEIRKIKEAEEDAMARALGLPVAQRGEGTGTGANNVEVGELNRVIKESAEGNDDIDGMGKGTGFGDFVGNTDGQEMPLVKREEERGGLLRKNHDNAGGGREGRSKDQHRRRRKSRSRSRSREQNSEQRHQKHRHGSRSGEREHHKRRRDDSPPRRRERSRSAEARHRRHRSRSPDRRYHSRRDDEDSRNHSRRDQMLRRSRSPEIRRRGRGERNPDRRR